MMHCGFFSVPSLHLFKRRGVIGRAAKPMTDGPPGGRSAVAKILSGVGTVHTSKSSRCDATVYPECKERVIPLVWQANTRGTLSSVYNICLSDLPDVTHV